MKVQLFGAIALSLTATASTVDRRSLLVSPDYCPTYISKCDCYEASSTRNCGWDSQAYSGGQCKKGSTFNQYELEDMDPEECDWEITNPQGHQSTQDDNCKQWTNACSCQAHETDGCGWKSGSAFQADIGTTEYDTLGNTKVLKGLGQCRWDANPSTGIWELENSNGALADLSDGDASDCSNVGCGAFKNPCDCYRAGPDFGGECGWSSSDYRNVDSQYILDKSFFSQGRCKSGSTTNGIEVAYYAYMNSDDSDADECLKAGDANLVDCESFTTACSCWEDGVVDANARCGWSSATSTCNYLSRFSQAEVAECDEVKKALWTADHYNEFEAISQSVPTFPAEAHVHQAPREWKGTADVCYYKDGNVGAGLKASRCECFQAFIGERTALDGTPLTSCGWTGDKDTGMCQEAAEWDTSDRVGEWAQEAFECLPYPDKRALCDPYMNITKGCECAEWAAQMSTLTYYDVEQMVSDTGNAYLATVWERVNEHLYGHLYGTPGYSADEIKAMTPFLDSSCWFDNNGDAITTSQHDSCMSWQFCGWSTSYLGTNDINYPDNACFHGEYTTAAENDEAECIPEPSPSSESPEPVPVSSSSEEPVYTYYTACNEINDPIVCALYSLDLVETNSAPFNKACTWNSGAASPCQTGESIMELQELMFAIEDGHIADRQVMVGGSVYLDQYYKVFTDTLSTKVLHEAASWVPHLPTLAYSHPWRPFVEADTCFIISDLMDPYVPQSYIANGAFDAAGSLYNCVIDTSAEPKECFGNSGVATPYPKVTSLTNPQSNGPYASGLEFLRLVDLKYIDVTANTNTGPTDGFCDATCQAERAGIIALTSATRAPLVGAPDINTVYSHTVLVDMLGVPMKYTPCVNAAQEFTDAQAAYAAGEYLENGLFGS